MAVPVNIVVKDASALPVAISGVTVNIYSPSSLDFIASAITDGSGVAGFLLPGDVDPGTPYEVRLYKPGIAFTGPVQISVTEPLEVGEVGHAFDVVGADTMLIPLASTDRLCRLQGVFIGLDGKPRMGVQVRVSPAGEDGFETPKVLDSMGLINKPLTLVTDQNGRVSFELPRHGKYWVEFAGSQQEPWLITVPNACGANLLDVIHPFPVELIWDEVAAAGNVVTLAVGETKTVPYEVMFSDFQIRSETMSKWLTFLNSDDTLIKLEVMDGIGALVITAIAAGSAEVIVDTKGRVPPVRLPDYVIQHVALSVTITP